MKTLTPLLLAILTCTATLAQMAPDFTITAARGGQHTLYADYLDQDKIVVIKFFFSTCPPCNASAPAVQALYEQWGEGNGDVQFVELSTQSWDNNSNVLNYQNQHGLTMPAAGNDGGGLAAANPYRTGMFGPFFGTPSYAVIEPNGTVNYPVFFNEINTTLESLTGGGVQQTTAVNVNIRSAKTGNPIAVNDLSIIMKPANETGPIVDLLALTGGTLQFEYPSLDFPEMNDPEIIISSSAAALSDEVTTLDLVSLARHILTLNVITDPIRLAAGDVNGNGTISGADVVAIRKVLLEIDDNYPNGTPSYLFTPNTIAVLPSPGGSINIDFEVIKMGDTN